MADPLRLFILAGEPSGDRIAADLVERLRLHANVDLSGVGGTELEALGLRSMFPMGELSVMGWADVLPRLPKLLWRTRQVARAIAHAKPDIVVLVDAQEFSRLVARQVRAAGVRLPVLLYVAPAVWAWKPERAAGLRPLFDEVLAVLPFEPRVMADLRGPPTSYVGHPALSRIPLRASRRERGPLLLLPGSREGELRRHLPLMREIAARFAAHPAIDGLVLPTVPAMLERVTAETEAWPVPVRVVSGEPDKLAAFRDAVAAVAVTGTVTLELALAGVPMVTTYVADKGQAKRWVKYKIKYAALPNIVLDRPLVPEILGLGADVEAVAAALDLVLAETASSQQIVGFAEMRSLMEKGAPEAPLSDPVERVLARARR
jgi:lipid-A-disaccharide synthase